MRILIAEDDMTSRLFMRKFLEAYGTCDVATNGLEVIDMVSEAINNGNYYDLICLDIMMPKVDGLKALQIIRELEVAAKSTLKKPSKVIMTTALNDHTTVEESYGLGAEAYAWKPIDMDKFIEILVKLELIKG